MNRLPLVGRRTPPLLEPRELPWLYDAFDLSATAAVLFDMYFGLARERANGNWNGIRMLTRSLCVSALRSDWSQELDRELPLVWPLVSESSAAVRLVALGIRLPTQPALAHAVSRCALWKQIHDWELGASIL